MSGATRPASDSKFNWKTFLGQMANTDATLPRGRWLKSSLERCGAKRNFFTSIQKIITLIIRAEVRIELMRAVRRSRGHLMNESSRV